MRRILLVTGISLASAFSTAKWEGARPQTALRSNEGNNNDDSIIIETNNNRRNFLTSSMATAAMLSFSQTASAEGEPQPTKTTDSEGVIVYKLPSGLQYIKLQEAPASNTATPRYGQLCIFQYKAYMKLPNSKNKEQFDSGKNYITKHGNARMLPGLDEGLHGMRQGELRRIIIPPKLGFVTSGLGPLPEFPWNRWHLNSLLDEMVKQRGGNLIYDVRLDDFFDDEADQGYYDDKELSPEEIEVIQNKLIRGGANPPPMA